MTTETHCIMCGAPVCPERWAIGRNTCLSCGEQQAVAARAAWCVVPMPKSNYILVTDRDLLQNLNSSHKGAPQGG